MILPILIMLAAVTILSQALLTGELAGARAANRTAVARAADLALSLAQAQLVTALQTSVVANLNARQAAANGIDGTFSTSSAAASEPGTPFWYAASAQVNGVTSVPGTTDQAENLQASEIAQEQRISAVVTAEVYGADPTHPLLATRTRLITLRLFAAPPYAIADGSRALATIDDTPNAEGDPAGVLAQPTDAATPDPSRPDRYHDTTIKARFNCAGPDNGPPDPGNDGLHWGTGSAPAVDEMCNPAPGPWATGTPVPTVGNDDALSARSWGNSNTNQSGWTR